MFVIFFSWLKRKINAQKLGIEFNRISNFTLPEKLRIVEFSRTLRKNIS